MRLKIFSVSMMAIVALAACGAPGTPPAPTSTPFVSPVSPIATPVAPTGGLITKPGAEQWAMAPAAALSARKALVEKLKIDPDTIKLVSVEQVDWPDACLGVNTPGVMCAQIIMSGYRVVMEAQGNRYEYHTDETGSGVKFAAQSAP